MEDLDPSLVSSGKAEAEAALGRATEEVRCFFLAPMCTTLVYSLLECAIPSSFLPCLPSFLVEPCECAIGRRCCANWNSFLQILLGARRLAPTPPCATWVEIQPHEC